MLVEVPGAPPVDADVEMEGMGLNRKDEGYGRLDDDWDDHEVSIVLSINFQVLELVEDEQVERRLMDRM